MNTSANNDTPPALSPLSGPSTTATVAECIPSLSPVRIAHIPSMSPTTTAPNEHIPSLSPVATAHIPSLSPVATAPSEHIPSLSPVATIPSEHIPSLSPVVPTESQLLSPQLSGGSKGSHTSDSTLTPILSETNVDENEDRVVEEVNKQDTHDGIDSNVIKAKEENEEERVPVTEEEIEEDIDEISFRELLPSESHRLQRKKHHMSVSSDLSDSQGLGIAVSYLIN